MSGPSGNLRKAPHPADFVSLKAEQSVYTWIGIGWYESIVSNAQVLSTVGFELLSITGSSNEHLIVADFKSA